jgi:hypothetical protein
MSARSDPSEDEIESERHRAGSAWTDRGTAFLVSGSPGSRQAAVRCHRRAVDLLSPFSPATGRAAQADLGTAWVNLGCALQAGEDRGELAEALGAFDRAIRILEPMLGGADSRFRHNLAAAWMGRADSLARIGSSRLEALQAYDRAIEIARGLPMDGKPSFRILLGSCGINRGNLLVRAGGAADLSAAVRSYDEALAALGSLARSGHRMARCHAASAWTNRGEALLAVSPGVNAGQAVDSGRRALAEVEGGSLEGPALAQLRLRALRVMALGLERLLPAGGPAAAPRRDAVAALTDIAERAIAIAIGCRDGAGGKLDPHLAWFFEFGARIYGLYQPQFLAEYLDEVLRRWNVRAGCESEARLRAIARKAVRQALEGLGRSRLIAAGTRQAELLMLTVHELRAAALRFES